SAARYSDISCSITPRWRTSSSGKSSKLRTTRAATTSRPATARGSSITRTSNARVFGSMPVSGPLLGSRRGNTPTPVPRGAMSAARPYAVASCDLLVGGGKHARRYFQAEFFGSIDVEHVFVFRRSLHREVGWFLAFQDAVAT